MRKLATIGALAWAGGARAQQGLAPIEVTATDGQAGVDRAMMWLAITALAMLVALWAVHWSIFRKR